MERKFYTITVPRELPEEERYKTLKDIGFAGVEAFGGKLTKERFDELASYGLELIHGGLEYNEDGTCDEDYVELLKSHDIDDVAMSPAGRGMFAGGFKFPDPNDPNYRYYGMPNQMRDYDATMKLTEQWNKEAKIAAQYGFKIHYHNHTHEFRQAKFKYLMDWFLENTEPNVVMNLDVGWALCAGIDVLSWMEKWGPRITSLHVKACSFPIGPEGNGHMAALPPYDTIGMKYIEYQARENWGKSPQGPMADTIVDWTDIFRVAEKYGCKDFILERERYYKEDHIEVLREDYNHIRACLDKLG